VWVTVRDVPVLIGHQLGHIKIEAVDPALVAHSVSAPGRLVKAGEPLLSIEHHQRRLGVTKVPAALERPQSEPFVSDGHGQQASRRVAVSNGDEEALHHLRLPHPAPLEVGQSDRVLVDAFEQLAQRL